MEVTEGCSKTKDTREDACGGEEKTNLGMKIVRAKERRKNWNTHLYLGQFAQHRDGEYEHDHVATEHLPDVKEDGLEADIVEAASSEDDNAQPIAVRLPCAQVDQELLEVETVLIRNLMAGNAAGWFMTPFLTSNSKPMPPASTFSESSGTSTSIWTQTALAATT